MFQKKKKPSNYQSYIPNTSHQEVNDDDSALLNCKLFFGSTHILDKNIVYDHFSQFGTVIDVYLRPETGTSGNVTFYELDVSLKLLKGHQYMELKDGKFIEIKEWKSRDDLRAKDISNIRGLRNSADLKVTIVNVDLPESIPFHSKARFKIRVNNKTNAQRILMNVLKESDAKNLKCLETFQPALNGHNSKSNQVSGIAIKERSYHDVEFEYEALNKGNFNLMLKFEMDNNITLSHILNIKVVDSISNIKNGTSNSTAEIAQFKNKHHNNVKRTLIPAFPPNRKLRIKIILPNEDNFVQKIGDYTLPDVIQRDVDKTGHSKSINPWNLRDNWKGRMRDLLFIEEAEHLKLIRNFDLSSVCFEEVISYKRGETEYYADQKDEPMLRLIVPGLAEKRPSVLQGDSIYAWIPGTTDYEYEGYVHVAEKNTVIVLFHLDFHRKVWNPQQKFNVRFGMQRFAWRIMHHATEKVELDVVWPDWDGSREVNKNDIPFDKIQLFDSAIAQNERQLRAIHSALNKRWQKKKVPFLLFGPFGTGKTKTLVELIQQIIVHMKDAKVLVCTPSNSAADVFAVKLAKAKNIIGSNVLLRLYATHRPRHLVPDELNDCINFNDSIGSFEIPNLQTLKRYKVIVSTCNTSSQLYGVGIGKDHFTHIIFDEAAQVMEPEALIPLSLANTQCTIIMAGDPKQMGPRFQNKSVQVHDLSKSIMERLSNFSVYKEGENRKYNCVDLVENYRSHKAIIHFASKQFYGSTLKAMADPKLVNTLQSWSKLPNQKHPVLYHAVEGQDMRDSDSPSFYNLYEVAAVTELIAHLINENKSIKQSEIGVITPFYKQVQKIRAALRQKKLGEVKVSGTDEFQGKEYKALFISTVRCSSKWKEYDDMHGLGLFNPRALNTSITRAIALLVVVGDPYIAIQDKNWKAYVDYCISNNSYIGDKPTKEYIDKRRQKDINSSGEISGEEFYNQTQKEELLKLTKETLANSMHPDNFDYHPVDVSQSLNTSAEIPIKYNTLQNSSESLKNSTEVEVSNSMDHSYYPQNEIKMPIPSHVVHDRFGNQFQERQYIDKNNQSPWMNEINNDKKPQQINGQKNPIQPQQPQHMGYAPWFPLFNNEMFSVYSQANFSIPSISIIDHQQEIDIHINIFRSVIQLSMSGNNVFVSISPDINTGGILFQTPTPTISLLIEFNENYLQNTEFYQTSSVLCINVSKSSRIIKFQAQTVKENQIPVDVPNMHSVIPQKLLYNTFQTMYGGN